MAFVQNVSLKEIADLCDTLGLLVDRMMEPNSLAMVVGITKNVIFSKLASKVLSEVELQHPIQKIIHNAAFLYTVETGDDSKVFLLLFKGIMNGIEDMLRDSNEIEVRRTILKQIAFFKSFIPDIFRNILNTYALFSYVNFCSPPKELEGLILTFFDSKFSANISKKLSSLIYSFLSHSISNSSQAIHALEYFISNFDAFCTKAIAPLSESRILEGFLLHKKLSPLFKHNKLVYFLVILNLPCKSDDAIWTTNGDSFSEKMEHLWDNVDKILKQLKHFEISLILTENGVSIDFESLCLQNDILIISRVSKEDIENILHLLNISPLNNLHDSVDPKNIGYLESLTSHVVSGTSFTHLKAFVNNHVYLVPHHILLCAPLEEVLKDYYSECLNCLKAVKQWLQPNNKQFFHEEKIQNHFEKDCNWLLNYSKPNMTFERNLHNYASGIAFPFGLFEFALRNILVQFYSEKLLSVKKLCDILDSALLTVIHKLWNTPKSMIVEEKDYLEFQKKVKCKIDVPIEPASNKENLLLRVLQLVEQLIKIDAILSIK
ncbi:Bardet-Biedl syndrome 10 protein homolog isoform X1 [Argiope bruennichi]|uniref:Bardet-Biedl syndrome 10 protein homolog isoform X1 n=1 Tax=Argiope bruennichi TaxID=94029 RepID=UPI002495A48B|nr:Bardet-Biedl syndrome 10 protein homolog isoform X1 [Argiope bruennichi]